MTYVVFWLEGGKSFFESFSSLELMEALTFAHIKRKNPQIIHVVMSSEHPDRVGKIGVDAVENGLLPDGAEYQWKKRRL